MIDAFAPRRRTWHPLRYGRCWPNSACGPPTCCGGRYTLPGERTRAALALLQARGVNLLVLDEPTNHLDLAAIEQLEAALASYPGTLLLVTHDRRMLEAVTSAGNSWSAAGPSPAAGSTAIRALNTSSWLVDSFRHGGRLLV